MLLVLAALAMPPTSEVGQVVDAVKMEDAAWLMASAAFFLASVALTMGLPAILTLIPERRQVLGLVGLWIWSIGTIGTSALAAFLILFRATIRAVEISSADVEKLSRDPVLTISLLFVFGAFYLGELVVALVLLLGSRLPRWIPALLLVHIAAAPVNNQLPQQLQGLQAIVLGAGLMAMAVRSTEAWAASRLPAAP